MHNSWKLWAHGRKKREPKAAWTDACGSEAIVGKSPRQMTQLDEKPVLTLIELSATDPECECERGDDEPDDGPEDEGEPLFGLTAGDMARGEGSAGGADAAKFGISMALAPFATTAAAFA